MTSATLVRTRAAVALRTGAALAALIALIDLAGMFAFGIGTAPVEVTVITSVLGAATLVGAFFAWRRATWGIWLAAVSRFVAALAIVPILMVPEAPKDAIPMSVVILVLTVVAVALLLTGLRARRA